MKTANEMRQITIQNNPFANYIETVVAPQIEEIASCGDHSFRIEVDKIPNTFMMSRPYICERVCEYLKLYGYATNTLSNNKSIDVVW
jgi:hypothetical protein